MSFLTVSDLMRHDVGQLIIIHLIERPLIHAEHTAQAGKRIDILARRHVDLVITQHMPRILQILVHSLHTVIRFRRVIDARLLLALIQKLQLVVIVHFGVVAGNENHRRRAIQDLLRRRRRICCHRIRHGRRHTGQRQSRRDTALLP